jgi:hypothetical protein
LLRSLLDARFDAIDFFLLGTADSSDCDDEDCSEFSGADAGSFGSAAGDAGSNAFPAEAI